jgi:hypothetical protein
LNVEEFIQRALQYQPESVEFRRRYFILICLQPALDQGDIGYEDDIDDAIRKLSETFVQLKNLWTAIKNEKPPGVV